MNQVYKQSKPMNKMALKILPALILVFIMITTVSAATSSYQYKIGSSIDIKNPCYFSGTYCTASATCALTVYNPDNLVIVNNQQMTYGGAYFNYTLPGNNYTVGLYKCDMTCTQSALSGSQTFYIEIQTGGNLGLFLILAIASFVLLIFAIWMQNEYMGFISGALFILTGLFSIIYGIGDLSNMYTNGIGWVMLGLGIMFLGAAGYSAAEGSGLFSGKDGAFEDSLDSDTWGTP